ncbi:MAG: Gfo/Idh/MocA family oxidoreductase [Clostridia bacterium]|nr:Gfo/Idh/MocA family oxidoreductase [Clostridia bacterium]
MLKVCIIGSGMITNAAHIPAYKEFPEEFEITGVCDINEASAKDTAERHGIAHYYKTPEEMLEAEKPDIVSVCGPNFLHKEHTVLALKSGAHVLCEKPLAFTKHDAEEMFELAKSKGKLLIACQGFRFLPERLAAKKYIDEHDMGDVYYGELSRTRRRGIPTWGTFHIKEKSCGGAFLDIGVHMLDSLVWFMGNVKIKSVLAHSAQMHKYETGTLTSSGARAGVVNNPRKFDPEEMDVEDFSCGMLTFENGARISFKIAWSANVAESSDIVLSGKNYGFSLESGKILSGCDTEAPLVQEPVKYEGAFPGHTYITENLIKVLKGEEELIIKPEETINVSTIIELFYKSADLGREAFADELD